MSIIEQKIESLAEGFRNDYLDLLMDKIHVESRRLGKFIEPSTARKEALSQLEELWENKYSIISGKALIKQISNWVNTEYNISINSNQLAQELNANEIPDELKNVIIQIENNEKW